MPNVKDTLQAMEIMADRAALRDLRDMLDALLALRTHLVLQDRTRADSLLLRLDRLLRHADSLSTGLAESPELTLRLQCHAEPRTTGYLVHLFDAESGDLASSTTRETFEAAVQLVRFQLGVNRDYYFAGTWTRHTGKLAVSTPRGMVLARSEPRATDAAVHGTAANASTAQVPETTAA